MPLFYRHGIANSEFERSATHQNDVRVPESADRAIVHRMSSEDADEKRPSEKTELPVQLPQLFLERLVAIAALGVPVAALALEHFSVAWPMIPAVAAFAASAFAAWRSRRFERAEVEVKGGDLVIARRAFTTAIATRSIAHAEVAQGGANTRLRLLDHRRAVLVELEVGSLEEAERWIAAVGLDLSARELATDRTRFSLGDTEFRVFALLFVLLGFTAPATQPGAFTLALSFYFTLAQRRIRVGLDGVEERRWGRRRFHSFSKMREVIQSETAVSLVTDAGTIALDLPTDTTNRMHRNDVFATVKRALDAHQRALGSDVTADLLARKGRAVGPWLESLSALAEGKGYRAEAVPSARLAEVLEDPAAEPTSRAAAALLLTRAGHAESVQRAIQKTAQLEVRVALDAAMEEDLEELDETTAALEQEQR